MPKKIKHDKFSTEEIIKKVDLYGELIWRVFFAFVPIVIMFFAIVAIIFLVVLILFG